MSALNLATLAILVIALNAFGRRFAGGLLSHWVGPIGGTQVARLAGGAMCGASVYALSRDPLWSGAAVLLFFCGQAMWGFPRYLPSFPFIRFRKPQSGGSESMMVPEGLVDTIGLSVNGVIACLPLALGAWWAGLPWWWVLAGGAVRGPTYWLAAACTPRWRWAEFEVWAEDQGRWILQPTAVNEFYAGAGTGLGLILALYAKWVSIGSPSLLTF